MSETGKISDGHHTFDELYEHRHALFLALVRSHKPLAWRSKRHADGKGFSGWFIAGLRLPTGMITYHLPKSLWEDFNGVETLDRAPEWDGHTPADVVTRLNTWRDRP